MDITPLGDPDFQQQMKLLYGGGTADAYVSAPAAKTYGAGTGRPLAMLQPRLFSSGPPLDGPIVGDVINAQVKGASQPAAFYELSAAQLTQLATFNPLTIYEGSKAYGNLTTAPPSINNVVQALPSDASDTAVELATELARLRELLADQQFQLQKIPKEAGFALVFGGGGGTLSAPSPFAAIVKVLSIPLTVRRAIGDVEKLGAQVTDTLLAISEVRAALLKQLAFEAPAPPAPSTPESPLEGKFGGIQQATAIFVAKGTPLGGGKTAMRNITPSVPIIKGATTAYAQVGLLASKR